MKKKDKLSQLKKILSSGKRLLIFNHFNPDPDSLAATLILSEIAKHFKVKSKIVYSGKVAYSMNLAMVVYLKLKIYHYTVGEEKGYDLTASVDTQKGMSNNIIPKDTFPQLTFDHHSRVSKSKLNLSKRIGKSSDYLYDIRTQYGSAASILLDYYLKLKLKLTTRIATAFCYAITAETSYFTRKYNPIDACFYRQAIQVANIPLIAKIQNTKKPVVYFQVLSQTINTYKKTGNLLTCCLGKLNNLDFLHEIANYMLCMDGIDFVAITGIDDDMKKICCRSNNDKVHLGNILQATLNGVGSGGGHEQMAAGEFYGKEKQVIANFKKYLKKFNVLKIDEL